jgi:hypothetical protein
MVATSIRAASHLAMRRTRLHSNLTWLVALTLLVQAIAFGWMRPAEAEDGGAPQIDGWVICTAHGDAPAADAPVKNTGGAARHDLTCTLCAAGCLAPMALAAVSVDVPLPSEAGRVERIAAATVQPRAPPFAHPNARGPPTLS